MSNNNNKVYYSAPTFDIDKNEWTETPFQARKDVVSYIDTQFKYPSEYNLKYTEGYWNKQSKIFQNTGSYPVYMRKSLDFRKHWDTEKKKCEFEGFIIYKKESENVEFAVPCLFYWYLNYCPIPDKVKKRLALPEIYDGDYHYFLYILRCILRRKYGVVLKKRQSGYTLKNMSILLNAIWFGNAAVSKIFAYDENKVKDSWGLMENYKDHINTHCGWTRGLDPSQKLNWQIRRKRKDGSYSGNMSIAKGFTTKHDPSNGVGGNATVIFGEESGINPTLDQTHEYITSNVALGGLTTGLIIYSGAVGELDKADPLKEYILHPLDYDFLGCENRIEDDVELGITTGFFAPEWWNYVSVEEDEKGEQFGDILRCYDEWGNTNKELALKEIDKHRAKAKSKKAESYRYYCSQRPLSIKEAFAFRKDSKFPMGLIEAQKFRIGDKVYPYEFVDLERDNQGKVIYKPSKSLPITEFPLSEKTANKEGVVVLYERPPAEVQFGTFYGSVDPVGEGKAEFVDNMVFVPKGKKRIGDIKIGDNVIGSDGKAKKVVGVFPQGVKSLYRVTFNDGFSVVVCDDHLWTIRQNGGEREESHVLSTKQLMNKEGFIEFKGIKRNKNKNYKISTYFKKRNHNVLRWKIPIVQPIMFENKTRLEIDPYLLGLLLGDGCISQRHILFSTLDQELISNIKAVLSDDLIIKKKKNSKCDYAIVTKKVRNSLSQALKKLKLKGLKSGTKFIPSKYSYSSVKNRLSILQGLMDADGYCGNHGAEYYSISKKLADGVVEITQSLGGIAKIRKKIISSKNNMKGVGYIYIVRIILPDLFVPFRLKRKLKKYYKPRVLSRYIKNIEYEKEGEAVCIQVDSFDNLYVTEHAIVTHNTLTSDSLCSIYIYKGDTEVTRIENGDKKQFIEHGKLVASWCGRFDDLNKTHQRLEMLIELYKARTIVENNISLFIQHMIFMKKQHYLVPKDQILFLKDLGANTNVYQEYGWKNTGTMFPVHLINYAVEFLKEVINQETKANGDIIKVTYGVERIPDIMLLKEMEAYHDGLNVDRLVAFSALVAFVRVQQSNYGYSKRTEEIDKEIHVQNDIYTKKVSPFRHIGRNSSENVDKKLPRNGFRHMK